MEEMLGLIRINKTTAELGSDILFSHVLNTPLRLSSGPDYWGPVIIFSIPQSSTNFALYKRFRPIVLISSLQLTERFG